MLSSESEEISSLDKSLERPPEYQVECSLAFACHWEMLSKDRWGSKKARQKQKQEEFTRLLQALAADTDFVTAIASDSNLSQKDLEVIIHNHATTLQCPSLSTLSFQQLQSRILSYDKTNADSAIQELCLAFQLYSDGPSRKKRRQNTANRMGFTPTQNTFHTLEVVKLPRLSQPYPPPDYIVLERSHEPEPKPLVEKDYTCKKPAKFHKLIESRLQYTIPADKSVVIVDEDTNEIVAIVIRSFAKASFPIIKKWANQLIRNTVRRRRTSQRNSKGTLVLFGTSTGPRNNKVVGWVRNLSDRWLKAVDRNEHDTELSSLFGLFYSLVQTQVSPEIVGDFEKTIEKANLPRIDFHGNSEFSIPFNPPVRFSGYEMAPPEGYAAIDYLKEIHDDKHFKGCPWGVYWNIVREQPQNRVGIESGANFFVADYGLRIVNSENVCVTWNISMKHGTSWYYDSLSHIGLAFILGKDLETTWNRRKQGEHGSTGFKNGLLIVDASDSEED